MTLAAVIAALTAWQPLGYLAIFSGLLLEGDLIIFSAMFLAQQGVFQLSIVIPVIIGAVFVNDLLWYNFGKSIRNKDNRLITHFAKKIGAPLDDLIARYPTRILATTKFVYGMMRPTLIRMGMLGVPMPYFLRHDVPAALFWIGTVGSIGYSTGASLYYVKYYFRTAEIILLAAFLSFIILWYFIGSKFIKKNHDNS